MPPLLKRARCIVPLHKKNHEREMARSGVGDAVAEEAQSGKLFDAADLRGNENGGLAGRVRNGDFNRRTFGILFAAAEAEAALGDVVALDDFFVRVIQADTSGETDAGADMASAIWFSTA